MVSIFGFDGWITSTDAMRFTERMKAAPSGRAQRPVNCLPATLDGNI